MSFQRMLWRVDRDRLKLVWRRHGNDVTCCEHKVPYGPVGFGDTWADALADFLRKREAL